MSLPQTLFESPTGLIHRAGLMNATSYSGKRAITDCGREVNLETWTRISMYDKAMFGRGPRAVRKMIDSSLICDRCFPQ